MVLVFAAAAFATHPDQPLADVAAVWAGHPILGCSTNSVAVDGELGNDRIAVAVVRFEHTTLRHHAVEVARAGGPRRASRRLATHLAGPALRGALVVGDGPVNGSGLARGFCDVLPGLPMFGGLASNGVRVDSTWTLVAGRPVVGWVSAIGFVGNHVQLGFGSANGWDTFGPEYLVTKSHANVVYQVDDLAPSALSRHCEHHDADELRLRALSHPIAIRDLDDTVVTRTFIGIEPGSGGLRFGGDIAQGSTARLMHATEDGLVQAARLAATSASLGEERFALVMSGAGRRVVLGSRAGEEIVAARDGLAPAVRMIGLETSAELVPDGTSDVHNQSISIATIGEGVGADQLP